MLTDSSVDWSCVCDFVFTMHRIGMIEMDDDINWRDICWGFEIKNRDWEV
jgi:hypothetical protein